jgi:hypothetical protein
VLGWAIRALKHIIRVAKDSVPPSGFVILNYSVRTKESDHVTEDNLVRITKKISQMKALRGGEIQNVNLFHCK